MASEALIFETGTHAFAFPLETVEEVLRPAWPHILPRAPYGCLGLLDVRGEWVPLFDLAVVLGLRRPVRMAELAADILNAHVLLVRISGTPVAFVVDHVLDVGRCGAAEDSTRAKAPGRAGALVRGTARAGNYTALLLDSNALLGPGRLALLERNIARAAPGIGS